MVHRTLGGEDPHMPLSASAPRALLHTREIVLHGYERADGLVDIDAQLTDRRAYDLDNVDRGKIRAGEPLHGMFARLTVDADLLVVGAEAATDFGPYRICGGGAESFSRLVGLTIRPGFVRAANERIGGTEGCTHLRELLQQMATVAFQTTHPIRARREAERGAAAPAKPRLLDTCHAYASDREVVRRRWPQFYTGDAAAEQVSGAASETE
jgi:hypothetical protein